MSIHFMAIVQAIDCLNNQDGLSPKTKAIYDEIRKFFPVFKDDTPKYKDIEKMIEYLKNKRFK